ncbi:MAG: hypothetical protein QNL88_17700, partial [Acidobacteriota bacterium]|nr:hypothetical protein [Acidobacteriota bacterium]
AALVPTFSFGLKLCCYTVRYEEPLVVEDLTAGVRVDVPLTTRYMKILETAIRGRPDQWLWYHDRWKQLRLGGVLA